MADAFSNREIAGKVHLSENTVKTHMQEIMRRLGARNRVQAAVLATKERWLLPVTRCPPAAGEDPPSPGTRICGGGVISGAGNRGIDQRTRRHLVLWALWVSG
jgi:hypothetical protein